MSLEQQPFVMIRGKHVALLPLIALVSVVIILPVIGITWWFKHRQALAEAVAAAQSQAPMHQDMIIHFSPEFAQRIQIKAAPLQQRDIAPLFTVTGEVTFDARQVAWVGARLSGRIRKVMKIEGDKVTAGEVLAEIESAELGRSQAEVLKQRAREKAAATDALREENLALAKITPQRDAELARSHAVAIQAERFAAEQAVRALGGSVDTHALGVLTLRSPISGVVVQSNIFTGQSVDPQHNAFQIAQLSHLWVELNVFESEITAVREGDTVDLQASADTSIRLEGKVAHVGAVIDTSTRSTRVRVAVNNPNGMLRPGQTVKGTLHASGGRAARPSIPLSAVTSIDGKTVVFVLKDATTVEIRPVRLGISDQTYVAIIDGLKNGEQVVTSGVFELKSELFR